MLNLFTSFQSDPTSKLRQYPIPDTINSELETIRTEPDLKAGSKKVREFAEKYFHNTSRETEELGHLLTLLSVAFYANSSMDDLVELTKGCIRIGALEPDPAKKRSELKEGTPLGGASRMHTINHGGGHSSINRFLDPDDSYVGYANETGGYGIFVSLGGLDRGASYATRRVVQWFQCPAILTGTISSEHLYTASLNSDEAVLYKEKVQYLQNRNIEIIDPIDQSEQFKTNMLRQQPLSGRMGAPNGREYFAFDDDIFTQAGISDECSARIQNNIYQQLQGQRL